MTGLLIIAALAVSIIPAIAAAILAFMVAPGSGLYARDRAVAIAGGVFVSIYVLSAWELIKWWVV